MAAKKFTRGTRRVRTGAQFDALREYIEVQRSCLMDAEAVLDCVSCAIDEDNRDASGPSYPSVLRIARELVHSVIDRLDSVKVEAAIAGVAGVSAETLGGEGEFDGVKEEAVAYVH